MEVHFADNPFRHVVIDGAFRSGLIVRAAEAWPAPEWPGWFRYDSPLERKRTCRDWQAMPALCRDLLADMLTLPVGFYLNDNRIVSDATLYGAGLHDMGPGDHLDIHVDADRHPILGLERRANAILFLSSCHGWNSLEFWNRDLTACVASVLPVAGRLVVFETGDETYHGVPYPVIGPSRRKSLAMYWWGKPRGESKRPRAQFVARAGEPPDPIKQHLRKERCGA